MHSLICLNKLLFWGLPRWLSGKKSTCSIGELQEIWVWSLGGDDPLEVEMATHSSILAWKIAWAEETDGLQSVGLQRKIQDKKCQMQKSEFFQSIMGLWKRNKLPLTCD